MTTSLLIPTELRYRCEVCGNEVTAYVEIIDLPICQGSLDVTSSQWHKPRTMKEVN